VGDIGRVDETTWFFQYVVRKRVTWGYVFAVLFLVFAEPSRASVLSGLWLAVAGEALRTWSSGTIVKNKVLATDGPYRLCRNPLYLGSFGIGLGVAIMGGRWWFVPLFAGFYLPVYTALIRKEEKRLTELYGETFAAYCREVPRLWPDWKAWPPEPTPYDTRRMWSKHREWQAWLALYAVTLYLLLSAN
jgi:protein-S-isoprenylcysteine O-methyltransferase Ste14